MSLETFSNINSILERDATDTTYKYSLLQSVIETCQEYPQFVKLDAEARRVHLPLGICVFKWIFYYYPFFLPGTFIALKKGEYNCKNKIAFRKNFETVCSYFEKHGGISIFYDELIHGKVDEEIVSTIRKLVTEIRRAIINGPICHLGVSQYTKQYAVFQMEDNTYSLSRDDPLSFSSMVSGCGTYSLSEELFLVFRDLGSFILGSGSVYRKWMEFLQKENSKNGVSEGELLKRFSMVPKTERDVGTASKFYQELIEREGCTCIWSGKNLSSNNLAIDHMLPFSVWKSNDLWNLVPADEKVNLKKSDDIPTPEVLKEKKDELLALWDKLHNKYQKRFETEISIGLLSGNFQENWREEAFKQLCENAEYLITIRGHGKWEPEYRYASIKYR